jgi:hypothetical protein
MYVYPEKNSVIKRIFTLLVGIMQAPTVQHLSVYSELILEFDARRKITVNAFEAAANLSENERPSEYQKALLACEKNLILLLQVAYYHRQLALKVNINLNNHRANIDWLRTLSLEEHYHPYPIVRALYHYICLSAEIFNMRLLSGNVNDQHARNFMIRALTVLRLTFNFRSELRSISYQATDNISGDFFTEVTEGIAHLFHVGNNQPCDSKTFVEKLSCEYLEQLDHCSEALLRNEKNNLVPQACEASQIQLISIGRIRQQRELIECFKNIWKMRCNYSTNLGGEVESLLESMDRIERLSSALTLLSASNQTIPKHLRLILKYELEYTYIKANVLHLEARATIPSAVLNRIKNDLRLIVWISIGILGSLEDEKLDGPNDSSLRNANDYEIMIDDITPAFLRVYFSARHYSPAIYSLIGTLCMLRVRNSFIPVLIDNQPNHLLNIDHVVDMLIMMQDPIMQACFVDSASVQKFMRDFYCSILTLCKVDYERRALTIAALDTGILIDNDASPGADCVISSVMNGESPIHKFIHNLIKHMNDNATATAGCSDLFSGLKENLTASIFECRSALENIEALDAVNVTVRQFILHYAPLVITYAAHSENGRYMSESKAIDESVKNYYQHLFMQSESLIPLSLPKQASVKKSVVDKTSFLSGVEEPRKDKKGAGPRSNSQKQLSKISKPSTRSSAAAHSPPPTIESAFKSIYRYFNGDIIKTLGFYQKYTSNRHDVTTRARALLGQAACLPYLAKPEKKVKELEIVAKDMFTENGELFLFSAEKYKKFKAEYDELLASYRQPVAVATPKPVPVATPPFKSVPAAALVKAKPTTKAVTVKSNEKTNHRTNNVANATKPTVTSMGMFQAASPKSNLAKAAIPAPERQVATTVTMEKFSCEKTLVSKELHEIVVSNVRMETMQSAVVVTPPTTKSKMKLSLLAARDINFAPFDPFDGSRVRHPAAISYTLEQKNLVNLLHEFRMHPVIHGGAPYDKLCYRETDPVSRSRDIDLHVCVSVDNLMTLCKINALKYNINLALSRIDSNNVAVIFFNSKLPNGEYDSLELSCLPVSEHFYKAALLAKSQEFLLERLLVDAHTLTYLNLNGEFDRVFKGNQIQLAIFDARLADEYLLLNRHRLVDIIKRNAKPNQRGIPMHMSQELDALVFRNWFKLQRSRNGKIKMKQFDSLFLQGFTAQLLDVTCQKRQLLSIFFPSLEHHMDDVTLSELRIFCRDFDNNIERTINEPRNFDRIYNLRVEFLTRLLLPSFKRRHNNVSELLENSDRFTYACKRLLSECMFNFSDQFDVHNANDARDTLVRRLMTTWRAALTNELAAKREAIVPANKW